MAARCPEVTVDVAVGQMRQVEFVANEEGDWAFHCHKSHHTMNAMGHAVPTLIGVERRGLLKKIQKLAPDYMLMGERGMADMGEMEMPLPDNTLPMMTGTGPYGPVEMGGMFSTLKVRKNQKPGDYSDPGWYPQPAGTQAFEWTGQSPATGGDLPPATRATPNHASAPSTTPTVELRVKKPDANAHKH